MDPERFLQAQEKVWPQALGELRSGAKVSHWMWFVFPQLTALGRSGTAKYYGLDGLSDARAYLAHPILGPRLREAAEALVTHDELTAEEILGPVDALKLRSSATLFAAAGAKWMAPVLARFYDGRPCPLTEEILAR